MLDNPSRGAIAQLVEQRTENPCVPGSIPGGTTFLTTVARDTLFRGAIAQLVEQRTENPCVPGSIPGGTTSNLLFSRYFGEMVEWSITVVLKTTVPRGTGGSNPSLSALIVL